MPKKNASDRPMISDGQRHFIDYLRITADALCFLIGTTLAETVFILVCGRLSDGITAIAFTLVPVLAVVEMKLSQ